MNCHALLGGSFDPIHNGHLHIARQILSSGFASTVVFLPNARHNFKQGSVVLDFANRFALVEAVLEPGMEVWPDDSAGSGYTSDLMQRLYQQHAEKNFLWVIGSDNLSTLAWWHDFNWLRENVTFLIIPRPDFPLRAEVLDLIKHEILQIEVSYVSSTRVRRRIKAGRSLYGLVPEAIEERVVSLYRPLLVKRAQKDQTR